MEFKLKTYNEFIFEGGWATDKTQDTKITPDVLVSAVKVLDELFEGFDKFLAKKDFPPIKNLGPIGSGTYYKKDLKEDPDKIYGDIDVLIELPIIFEDEKASKRALEIKTLKKYRELLFEYLEKERPNTVDYESSKEISDRGSTSLIQLIISPVPGGWSQIDLFIAYPKASDWTLNRFAPERGYKGFTIALLYSALSQKLGIVLRERGAIVTLKDGKIVSGKIKTGTTQEEISYNFRTFLYDIAKWYAKYFDVELVVDTSLEKTKGMDPDNITIENLCTGIKALARTLDKSGIFSPDKLNYDGYSDFIEQIREKYNVIIKMELEQAAKHRTDTELTKLANERMINHAEYGMSVVNKNLK